MPLNFLPILLPSPPDPGHSRWCGTMPSISWRILTHHVPPAPSTHVSFLIDPLALIFFSFYPSKRIFLSVPYSCNILLFQKPYLKLVSGMLSVASLQSCLQAFKMNAAMSCAAIISFARYVSWLLVNSWWVPLVFSGKLAIINCQGDPTAKRRGPTLSWGTVWWKRSI